MPPANKNAVEYVRAAIADAGFKFIGGLHDSSDQCPGDFRQRSAHPDRAGWEVSLTGRGLSRRTDGANAEELSEQLGLDLVYTAVWCRTATACELLDSDDDNLFKLAPHVATLMLDRDFPGYIGGLPRVMHKPEIFEGFSDGLKTGDRTWWDGCSPELIEAVGGTGHPSYTRLAPNGLSQVPGLAEKLIGGASVAELACGSGTGLVRMASSYPGISVTGVDGDAYSLELARKSLDQAGAGDRASLRKSMLEDWDARDQFDLVFINISMHECRDIDRVTENVLRSLKPGGCFVISDFPFPGSSREARTVPGRIMSGIQFFEARIDDQLMPTQAFVDLLVRHRFRDTGVVDLTPMHAVTYGWK